eukprot:6062819-Amphidinium_carterae.1
MELSSTKGAPNLQDIFVRFLCHLLDDGQLPRYVPCPSLTSSTLHPTTPTTENAIWGFHSINVSTEVNITTYSLLQMLGVEYWQWFIERSYTLQAPDRSRCLKVCPW